MKFDFKTREENGFEKVSVHEEGQYLSFDEVFGLLENSAEFKEQLLAFLLNVGHPAYNIECPSVTVEDVSKAFEFVVVPCPELDQVEASSSEFTSHFNNNDLCAIFENLGGDAVLISPKPISEKSDFGHLKSFLQNAEKDQIHDLLAAIGEIASANLGNEPIYINTSGLGVPWLHVRIDDNPKYYQFKAYTIA